MTSPSDGGVAAAGGISELGAEAQRARTSYGEGARRLRPGGAHLSVCVRLSAPSAP
jgi:hypothetical protein